MMTKFFLGVAIVAFTTFCGYFLARKYRQRKMFFTQLQTFNERFLNEITYYRRPLTDFLNHYTYKGEFQLFLRYYLYAVGQNTNTHNRMQFPECSFLTTEEKNVVEDYFLMLGKGDSVSQKTYFSAINEQILRLKNEAVATHKKYGDLYIKLGFLCGLFLLILML